MLVTNVLLNVSLGLVTVTVVEHTAGHTHPVLNTVNVYVVVLVGVTAILLLLRFGYKKFNHVIFGVIVASIPLIYNPLRIAVCQAIIVGVVVVS